MASIRKLEKPLLLKMADTPYISDGKVNASLKGDLDPTSLSLEEAVTIIDQKRLNPPKKKKPKKKKK